MRNWDRADGVTVYRDGYYFSCNYLCDPFELVKDMAQEFHISPENAKEFSPLWLAFIEVMSLHGFRNDADLEITLQKIWTENASKYSDAQI